jgi:4-hydroxyphenylacetate 3-hydroxylase C terminal
MLINGEEKLERMRDGRAQLVPGASHQDHRHAAHAGGRRAAADAGEYRPRRRSAAQGSLRALVGTADVAALDPRKLYKLVWDLIGSEFAGRHMLYERFYAGNSIIVRNQSDRVAPWEAFHATVDGLLGRITAPSL